MSALIKLLIAALVDALVKQIPTVVAWWERRRERKARTAAADAQLAADQAAIEADIAAANNERMPAFPAWKCAFSDHPTKAMCRNCTADRCVGPADEEPHP